MINIYRDRWSDDLGQSILPKLIEFLYDFHNTREAFDFILELCKPLPGNHELKDRFLDYRGINLNSGKFSEIGDLNLDYGIVSYSSFIHCDFALCNFNNVESIQCYFERTNFDAVVANNTNFTNTKFNKCCFAGAKIENSNFTGTHFIKCDFPRAQASNTDFTGATFEDTTFGIHGTNVILDRIHFPKFLGIRETISLQFFRGAYLSNAKLNEVKFIDCDFSEADLSDSVFTECSFSGVKFANTNLTRCVFSGCDCSGVDFSSANLDNIEFVNCNMEGAILPQSKSIKPELPFSMLSSSGLIPARFTPDPKFLTLPTGTDYVYLHAEKITVMSIERADIIAKGEKGESYKVLNLPVKIASYSDTIKLQVQGNWKVMVNGKAQHYTDGMVLEVTREKLELV